MGAKRDAASRARAKERLEKQRRKEKAAEEAASRPREPPAGNTIVSRPPVSSKSEPKKRRRWINSAKRAHERLGPTKDLPELPGMILTSRTEAPASNRPKLKPLRNPVSDFIE